MPLFPAYKCFGLDAVTTLSASFTFIECLNLLFIFFASLIYSSGTTRVGCICGTDPSLLPFDIDLSLD
jgi:hypothetical protein